MYENNDKFPIIEKVNNLWKQYQSEYPKLCEKYGFTQGCANPDGSLFVYEFVKHTFPKYMYSEWKNAIIASKKDIKDIKNDTNNNDYIDWYDGNEYDRSIINYEYIDELDGFGLPYI